MAVDGAGPARTRRPRIPGGAAYLAHKHGITTEQVNELVEKVGTVKYKLDAAAEKLKDETAAKDVPALSPGLVGRLKEIVSI